METTVFNYECNSDDLYVVEVSAGGEIFKPNRATIRNLVAKENRFYTNVVSSGGSKHQAELDVADALVGLLSPVVIKDGSLAKAISDVFTEERVAYTLNVIDMTTVASSLQQEKHKKNKSSVSSKVILTIVFSAAVLFIAMVVVMGR
ncbi:Uncharacterised protein [Serratia proteamaculans]|uniref:hypothetical protein n=1 Tax=Serratia proteamaculans TaxID=28151 RepID=UPI00217A0D68|nr:hypothetical protein [Serratia proteamaculans]CAI0728659.1 Uncharacterised protein [Serratia proteamaculans]CAI1523665.1 Uncharacterised protein [Serratia proteamaculans]